MIQMGNCFQTQLTEKYRHTILFHNGPLSEPKYNGSIITKRDLGESTDLGNTFWQGHFGKNKKMHLGRGLVKPLTEVLISRPRFYQALDQGFVQPSTEVFLNPQSRY